MHAYRGNPRKYTDAEVRRTRSLYCIKCRFHAPFRKEKIRMTEETVIYRYTCPECGSTRWQQFDRRPGGLAIGNAGD